MKIEIKSGRVQNLIFDNLVVELQTDLSLCTIYKPHSVMGERLGAFLYKDMKAPEFFNEVAKYLPVWQIQDREAGNIIRSGMTHIEAEYYLNEYEKEDQENDSYEVDFYEIIKMQ